MTRSKRIQSVARITDHRERQAAQAFGESRQQLDHQEQRLIELLGYRDEYNTQFQTASGMTMDARRIHEYRLFLDRLNRAIEQQRQVVEQVQLECERQRQGWLATRTRKRALGNAVARFQDHERHEAERREQIEHDERTLHPSTGRPRED